MDRTVSEGEDRVGIDLGDVRRVEVALVGGDVMVTATSGPSRVEVECVSGPPVEVVDEDGVLLVRQPAGLWSLRRQPRAVVSVQCPPAVELHTTTVTAPTLVAGLAGDLHTATVSGVVTLGFVGGDVQARSVSGRVEMEGVSGRLRVETVSGAIDLAGGRLAELEASSASGDLVLDLEMLPSGSYRCRTVTGDVALRVPADAVAEVEAVSVSGALEVEGRRVSRGGRPVRTTVGANTDGGDERAAERARITLRTVSGRLAVVPRPPVAAGPALSGVQG